MTKDSKTVLLVESDEPSVQAIKAMLEAIEVRVLVSHAPSEATLLADSNRIDLVICELVLPGHSGVEFLYEFRSYPDWQSIPCIVFTTKKLDESIVSSRDWRLLDVEYLYKPKTTIDQLREVVKGVMRP